MITAPLDIEKLSWNIDEYIFKLVFYFIVKSETIIWKFLEKSQLFTITDIGSEVISISPALKWNLDW